MLSLYKILEDKAADLKVSGTETAKCAEVAANIAIDVLKMESEGIKAVKELINVEKKKNTSLNNNLRRHSSNNDDKENDDVYGYDPTQQQEEYNPNRKF